MIQVNKIDFNKFEHFDPNNNSLNFFIRLGRWCLYSKY